MTLREHWRDGVRSLIVGSICAVYLGPLVAPIIEPVIGKLAVVDLEKGFGLDVPGVALGEDWMLVVMNAIGLGTLRHGIQKSGF